MQTLIDFLKKINMINSLGFKRVVRNLHWGGGAVLEAGNNIKQS